MGHSLVNNYFPDVLEDQRSLALCLSPSFSLPLIYFSLPSLSLGFPHISVGEESACNAGDLGLIPGLGRSPGEGKGYPLQYPGLENSMDYTVHGVTKSQTRLSDFHFHFTSLSLPLSLSLPPLQPSLEREKEDRKKRRKKTREIST